MKPKGLVGGVLAVCSGLVLFWPLQGLAADAVKTVKIHSQMPVGHYVTQAVDLFIKEAVANSKGTLKFIHYPAQQLYKDSDMPDVLPKGGVEMAQINGAMWIGKVPETGTFSIPSFYEDLDHYYRDLYDYKHGGTIGAFIQKGWDRNNVKHISTLLYSPNNCVLSTKKVQKMEDYKGLKIRGWGKHLTLCLNAWGAATVVMSSSEVYMAMQRGTIDGVFSGMTSHFSRKWFEVAKHTNVIEGFAPAVFDLLANADFWKTLSLDQKKAVFQAGFKAEIFCINAAVETWKKAEKALKDKGVEVLHVPAAEAQRMTASARAALEQELLHDKSLPKGTAEYVMKTLADTKDATTTWQEACKMNNELELSRIQ